MSSLKETIYLRSPVAVQNLLVSVMGYNLYRKRYSGIFSSLRDLVKESHSWSDKERSDYQALKLHDIVKHCVTTVPYYQKLFSDYGYSANQFTSPKDLTRLPILTKKMLVDRASEFKSINEPVYITQHTSGSTGTPLALSLNEQTYKLAMALLVDYEERLGIPFGTRRATFAGRMIQKPDDLSPPFSRFNRFENQRLYSSYHLNERTFPYYKNDLNKFSPLEIIGYPSSISDLAGFYELTNTKPDFFPKAII